MGNRKIQPQDIWRVHTPNLLKEILNNPGTAILSKPLAIFGRILADVGERAAIINDKELNKLMIRLAIYSVADPASPDYDSDFVEKTLNA